jgi:hypothetical protein
LRAELAKWLTLIEYMSRICFLQKTMMGGKHKHITQFAKYAASPSVQPKWETAGINFACGWCRAGVRFERFPGLGCCKREKVEANEADPREEGRAYSWNSTRGPSI